MVITDESNEFLGNRSPEQDSVRPLNQFYTDSLKPIIFAEHWKNLSFLKMSDIVWWSTIRKISQSDVCGNMPTRMIVADFSGWHNFQAVEHIS